MAKFRLLFKFLILGCIMLQVQVQGQKESCIASNAITGEPAVSCSGYNKIPNNIPISVARPNQIKILFMTRGGNFIETVSTGQLSSANNLPNLSILSLQRCHIKTIQVGAFTSETLVELNISDNNIEVMDLSIFLGMPKLQQLYFRNNPLKRFQYTTEFPSLNLTHLDMSNCGLKTLDIDLLKNLKLLNYLHVRDNEFTTLDWRVFRPLIGLRAVVLYGNPWNCDCQIKFLRRFLSKQFVFISNLHNTTCVSSPPNHSSDKSLTGLTWDAIRQDRLICYPEVDMGIKLFPKSANGRKIGFSCKYSGYPKPEVKWLKDGKPFYVNSTRGNDTGNRSRVTLVSFNNPGVQVETEDENDEELNYKFEEFLRFDGFQDEDSGKYECVASNLAGNASDHWSFQTKPKTTKAPATSPSYEEINEEGHEDSLIVEDKDLPQAFPSNDKNSAAAELIHEENEISTAGSSTWLITTQFFVIILLIAFIVGSLLYLKKKGITFKSIQELEYGYGMERRRRTTNETFAPSLFEEEHDYEDPMLLRPAMVTQ